MKDLIFLGGAKGTGKSTVIKRLQEYRKIDTINTGEIYLKAIKNRIDPEKAICDFLVGDYKGIVDTHYTGGYSNGGFSRGLSKENLKGISKSKSIDLILLDLEEDILLKRRCESKEEKYRDRRVMCLELESNRNFFEEYCKDLLITGMRILNIDCSATVKQINCRIE